ncbi:putative proteinD-DEPENDENT ALCOHOL DEHYDROGENASE [Salix koriyanagi]|uniref:Alcohol dehydrogenase-like N-terminal domain-containing protein n=1 Tax=Salix koriyanagi TaxID=2511006 RepID=A0A9Q0ZBH7_9ROSI|nr:putative proteinD-DEPENDENT ALCOHOL DEHYDROGENASE [Salix koriyanagi]
MAPRSSLSSSYHVSSGGFTRGVVFWEPNMPVTIEEFQMPRPKAGEVLIKTKACGVCHSDLHVIKGEIPFPSPCAIGHEITGEKLLKGKPISMYSMGGLAEYCVVPAHGLTILPNSLPYSVFTVYGAMAHAAQVRPGDSVAVIGVGGVGSR